MLKVKGMSVFPAEIEAILGQHPGVIGSGVIGRTMRSGDRYPSLSCESTRRTAVS
jgi:acyl-coenzyme A synthetase/AMP-(fatty) acid ligase